jgi:uncharacterized protein YoxC
MSEKTKNLDEQVDKLEAAAEKYASKDTVISIGGYEFTPAKLMIAFTIVTSILGGLYGAFEVYKDYMDMKQKIAEYVTPDLSELYKKMEVLGANTEKMTEYTNNIKNDLKQDVRRLEGVVENVERSSKTDRRLTDSELKETKRDVDSTLKEIKRDVDNTLKEINREMVKNQKDMQNEVKNLRADVQNEVKNLRADLQTEVRSLKAEVDNKIKTAIDNPLANK